MALGSVYLITMFSTLRSQQCVNTFTYEQTAAGTPDMNYAVNLAQAFETSVLAVDSPLRQAQFSVNNLITGLRVQNLFDPTDYTEVLYSPVLAGTGGGDYFSPFISVSFRTQWLGGVVRRGFKRFQGVLETVSTNGTLTPAAITQLEPLGDKLSEVVAHLGAEFSPCVVKRIKETDPITGKVTYRLPENPTESVSVTGLVYVLQPELTTQNSRKIGRGV